VVRRLQELGAGAVREISGSTENVTFPMLKTLA